MSVKAYKVNDVDKIFVEMPDGGGSGAPFVPIVKDYFSGAEFEKGQWNLANPAAQGVSIGTDVTYNVGILRVTPAAGGNLSICPTKAFFLSDTFEISVYLLPQSFESTGTEDLLYTKFALKDSTGNDAFAVTASKDPIDVSNTNWLLNYNNGGQLDSGVPVDDTIYTLFTVSCVAGALTAKCNGVALPGSATLSAGVYNIQYESESGATLVLQFQSAGVALLADLS